MSALSCEAGNLSKAPAWLLPVSKKSTGNPSHDSLHVPENSSSVWQLALMRNIRAHCVPVALVVMIACVIRLQNASLLQTPSVDIAMAQLFGTDDDAHGILAVCSM